MNIQKLPTSNTYELQGIPKVLVLHTTLGAFHGAVEWLRTTPEERLIRTGSKTYSSAHMVFGREGEIAELAGADVGTWHAGGVRTPTERALKVLPLKADGSLENPNRHTIGYEFSAGYDIDRDGILESWEKSYTPEMVKAAVWYTLNVLEPEIERIHGERVTFTSSNIITHHDINSNKPNLELQRSMFIAELDKQRGNKIQKNIDLSMYSTEAVMGELVTRSDFIKSTISVITNNADKFKRKL